MLILFFLSLLIWVFYLKYHLYNSTFKTHIAALLIFFLCFGSGLSSTYALIHRFKEINLNIIQTQNESKPYFQEENWGVEIQALNHQNWQKASIQPFQHVWTQENNHFGILRQVQKSNLNIDLLCRKNFSLLFDRISIGDTVRTLIDQKSWLKYQFQAQYEGKLVHILSYGVVSQGYFYQMISWTDNPHQLSSLNEIHESFSFR